ncbi:MULTISPECIES: DUF3048 domain-containing protein [Streptomycetaceae]|uniref:DUF3048 domain-containing protein n=2 Tax=Kitasatosporales TaxID=85011 RepID=UPI001F408CBF|nr:MULTISPECIES: DUF3048 domain-containing protein [Streptomycetaceae]
MARAPGRPARAAMLVVLAVFAVFLVSRGCGGPERTPGGPASTSTGSVPGTSAVARSPFTGLPGRTGGPVLAVKIDNVGTARPHTGLERADLVYVEQVESGLTRLLAVFSSQLPDRVGPVRSARESDLELLRQFGSPALAFSGAQSRLLPVVAAAPVYDVSPARAPGAYARDGSRPAPHNLYAAPDRLLAAAPDAAAARDIGFRFGDAPPGGTPERDRTVRYPNGSVGLHWSAEGDRWLVSFDGDPATTTDGGRLGAPTVVVQYVTVRPSDFHDRWGNTSPYSETVGTGRAEVLRDGKAYDATWSRPDAAAGTRFTTPGGQPVNFDRGQVWIVLAPLPR